MACFSGTKLVNDGAVLRLDAGNRRSYIGSGTNWNNLKRNVNDGTLINGVTYDTLNKGSLVFDGSNDHVDFFAPNLGTTCSVEMWVKLGASYSAKMFFGWLRYSVYCASPGHIGFNTAASDCYGINVSEVTALGLINSWHHYVFEMRTDVSYTNNKIYIDGIQKTLSQQTANENGGNRTFNSGNGRIGGWKSDLSYKMQMNCSTFNIYNRSLSAAEIKQNFEATRGRYGI